MQTKTIYHKIYHGIAGWCEKKGCGAIHYYEQLHLVNDVSYCEKHCPVCRKAVRESKHRSKR
jgi:hypothetical protein